MTLLFSLSVVFITVFLCVSCAKTYVERDTFKQAGWASWYGPGFHGRTTANGEKYDQFAMTAAHKKLPFNTKLRVTNLENGKSIFVRINDRGPYKRGRVIDLSKKGAIELGFLNSGVTRVVIEEVAEKEDQRLKIEDKRQIKAKRSKKESSEFIPKS